MIRRPPRSTLDRSSAASDVYKRQGREQRPVAAFDDALHEQVRNPVRRVHVVRAPAIIASVLAQLEEFLDVEVPGFQIRADRTLALAAVVREPRGRHVRLIDIHLQVDDERLWCDGRYGAHAREYG